MLISAVFLLVLLSGGVFAAACFGMRAERALPITLFSIILLLYACGLAGALRLGVYLVLGLAAALYLSSIVCVCRGGNGAAAAKRILTPAVSVFLLLYLLINACNAGRLVANWDAFSHWADTVKIMVVINDFGAASPHAMFPAYPPAMALLQYFVQALGGLMGAATAFCEWRLYLAFQSALLIPFIPFLTKLEWNRPGRIALAAAVTFVVPLLFLRDYAYNAIVIDPFLGVLAGYGLAAVLLREPGSRLDAASIVLMLPVLALSKAAGALLAVCIPVAFALDALLGQAPGATARTRLRGLIAPVCGAASLLAGKLSWSHYLVRMGIDAGWDSGLSLAPVLELIRGDGGRRAVLVRFLKALLVEKQTVGHFGLGLSVALITLLLAFALLLLAMRYPAGQQRKRGGGVYLSLRSSARARSSWASFWCI